MTEETRKAKMLRTVRGLLDKAAATTFEAEAATFREKADQLMTQYAIEQWELDQAKAPERERPERRDYDFGFYRSNNPFKDNLWHMMIDVSQFCRCVPVGRALIWKTGEGKYDIPIIGKPSDLDYFDLLFTSLMHQFINTLEPKWDSSINERENIYRLKNAGMKWEFIAEQTGKASKLIYWQNGKKKISSYLINEYKKACAEHGTEPVKAQPDVWARSFALGFTSAVGARMREMRAAQFEGGDNRMALVVRDSLQEARELASEMFPPQTVKSSGRSVATREQKIDPNAVYAGQRQGAKADIISAGAGGRLRQRGQLGS